MKIGIFSDSHYCGLKFEDERHPELSFQKIKEMMDDFKNQNVEQIICLGDLLHYEPESEKNRNNLIRISELINSYAIPFSLILGNHDCEIFTAEDYAEISGFALAPLSMDFGGTKLILLDACCDDDGTVHLPPANDWTNSYVPDSQLEWFKSELSDKSKNCIVFIHQCLDYSVECHHIVRNAVLINSIISDAGNVTQVYSGHYHPGKESVVNSIPYTTLRAMVMNEDNSYLIIEI